MITPAIFLLFWKTDQNLILDQFTKKGNTNLASNYRPISVLPYLSNFFEKLIFTRIADSTDYFSLINSCQFGFPKNKSTAHTMIKLVE